MSWVSDPTAWLGLLTLVVMEIVLGIDNLVFIAILASKLPLKLQAHARYTGLGFALLIRIILICFISWIVQLTEPLFYVYEEFGISVRDLIMLVGGAFLLYKATHELHEKLEGKDDTISASNSTTHAFWLVVIQIVVLDAVFSLDSVITAVGMCDHVFIMIFAVILAMIVMVIASKPLTSFVSSHPTLIILCLSFLLMIGFSLLAEGLHIHVPKAYLYAAIGFSIIIEIFNQIARKNSLHLSKDLKDSRELAASLVLRIIGSKNDNQFQSIKESIVAPPSDAVFESEEKDIVSRVLQLSGHPIRAVMTPRAEVEMIDISLDLDEFKAELLKTTHSKLVAYKDANRDAPLGIIDKAEILNLFINKDLNKKINLSDFVRVPLYVPETISVLKAIEESKRAKNYTIVVLDEFGSYEGLATLHDIMEEIAGDLPDTTEVGECVKVSEDHFMVDADIALNELERQTGFVPEKLEESIHYHTLAGFIIEKLQALPEVNSVIKVEDWELKIVEVGNHSIERVELTRVVPAKKED